jgi:hypothetical protein
MSGKIRVQPEAELSESICKQGMRLGSLQNLKEHVLTNNPTWTMEDISLNIVQKCTEEDNVSFQEFLHIYHCTVPHPILKTTFSRCVSEVADIFVICHHTCIFIELIEEITAYFTSTRTFWSKISRQQPAVWINVFATNLWLEHPSTTPPLQLFKSLPNTSTILIMMNVLRDSVGGDQHLSVMFPLLGDLPSLAQTYAATRSRGTVKVRLTGKYHDSGIYSIKHNFKECVSQFCEINIGIAAAAGGRVPIPSPPHPTCLSEEQEGSSILEGLVRLVVTEMAQDKTLYSHWKHLFDLLQDGVAGEVLVGNCPVVRRKCRGDDWSADTDSPCPLRPSMPAVMISSTHKIFREATFAVNEQLVGVFFDWFARSAAELIMDGGAGTDNQAVMESGKLLVHMLLERNNMSEAEVSRICICQCA